MLKAGIFLDIENLIRNGGWGLRYDTVRELVEAQGATILRANAYMAIDSEREARDPVYRQKKEEYRAAIRRTGFHLGLKEVRRYQNAEGETIYKASSDMEMAIDAILQAENLDYILLGTGDGDFLRLVRALQSRGKRVDLMAFQNVNQHLQNEVDYFFSGFTVPDMLRNTEEERYRGVMHFVNEERGFGFISVREGLGLNDVRDDIFCHILDVTRDGEVVDNTTFGRYKMRGTVLEFDLDEQEDGRVKAVNVEEFYP